MKLAFAAAGAAALIALTATDAAADIKQLRTPAGPGSAGCIWGSADPEADQEETLRCDFRRGERRPPRRPDDCELDWGGAFVLPTDGRAHRICRGDTAYPPGAEVLRFGRRWRAGSYTCDSRRDGLRCVNRAGRGMLLRRNRTVRFF
jgi:hypothetical protein